MKASPPTPPAATLLRWIRTAWFILPAVTPLPDAAAAVSFTYLPSPPFLPAHTTTDYAAAPTLLVNCPFPRLLPFWTDMYILVRFTFLQLPRCGLFLPQLRGFTAYEKHELRSVYYY